MSCERHRSELTDVALGLPASPALEAHLAGCPRCVASLEAEQRLVGTLDRELQALAGEAPSGGFEQAVRRRLATETPPAELRLAGWLLPVAAGVVLLLAGVYVLSRATVGRHPPPQEVTVEPSVPRPAVAEVPGPLPAPPPGAPPRPAPTRRAPVREAPAAYVRTLAPEVLIPPGEEAVVRRLIAGVRRPDVDLASLVAGNASYGPTREAPVDPPSLGAAALDPSVPKEVTVAPIHVAPLSMEPITRGE